VPCAELREGDALLVAPGDLVPVGARLESAASTFSLDWIQGESRPRTYQAGDVVPAGAFASGKQAATLRAVTDFAGSPLRDLLRQPERPESDAARSTPWWQTVSRLYVAAVLAVAGAGFVGWWVTTHDVSRALGVTTAVLIVTCPCAFGIATPLAYEMAQAGLRRRGLFVRRGGFLDRACSVRRVVFDKTGTLTTGALALSNPEALQELDRTSLTALYDMVARSGHPKSAAIREAIDAPGLCLTAGAHVVEQPGLGLELRIGDDRFRVGAPSWAAPEPAASAAHDGCDVVFSRNGQCLAAFATAERLRPDAAREVRALRADGYQVWLVSGDAQVRVDRAGHASGIAFRRCLGDHSPEDKARFVERHDHHDTLFVGDGVNDALALDLAYVSGTPAVDRPFVPARADFFFVTAGLGPIRLALRTARAVAQVVRADLAIAVAYNVFTVGLALAGRMSPLACAVLMPLSSLTTIAVTALALSPRSRLWKS
jgi:Cu2+-exporting ATPase